MKKYIFIPLILISFVYESLSQNNEQENIDRYWKYRKRFSTYFTYQGFENGAGHVVCIRNRTHPKYESNILPNLDFGQHGIHFGYYLGVLSTEYLLLSVYNQTENANETLKELSMAISAYKEQMDKCEDIWGKEKIVDGFFVRENIPVNFLSDTTDYGVKHKKHFNQELTPVNVWNAEKGMMEGVPKGHPGWVDMVTVREKNDKEPMSQDEAYGIMMGLSLVVRCVPELRDEAMDLYEKIVLHLINKNPNYHCSGISYYIYRPDCHKVSESAGGNTGALGYGIAAAAAAVTNKDIDYFINSYSNKKVRAGGEKPYNRKFYDRLMKEGNMKLLWKILYNGAPGDQEWNRSMASTLAAMGDSWYPHTAKGIENNALHNTKGRSAHDWRSFYLTLWRFLYNQPGNTSEKSLIMSELASAPWEGPYSYATKSNPDNHSKGGWAHEYRYRATYAEQYQGIGHKGIYNGLDYMLMYNLYHLVYASDDAEIVPYIYPSSNTKMLQNASLIPNWEIRDVFILNQKVKSNKKK